MFILLFAMTTICVVITLNHFLKSDAEQKQQVVAENRTTREIILRRKCRAAQPLKDDEYCVRKIKKMYRENI